MPTTKPQLYQDLAAQLPRLLQGGRDFVANAANFAALLFHSLPDVNWVGFYVLNHGDLLLGPFQGPPACGRIPLGKGVCGKAAQRRIAILVDDVHQFPSHIACDSASNSEIVLPIIQADRLIGVLDLDSPLLGRFDDEDRRGLHALVEAFVALTDLDVHP
jgi:L-methionine (R)-S-oxide reductase